MSYWIVALTPAALSARNRPAIASKVSFTVGIGCPPVGPRARRSRSQPRGPPVALALEREQIHSAGHRQHRTRDVARALRAEERDRVRDVLGLALSLHRDPLHHPLVHR